MYSIFLFYKKYKNFLVLFYFHLFFFSPILLAEDEHTYIHQIANLLNEKRGGPLYSLELHKTGPLANTRVFEQGFSRASIPNRVCNIRLNMEYIKNHQLSVNAIAVIIGHEMGHCEKETLASAFSHLSYSEKNWSKEYEADLYGIELANKVGFNGMDGFKELSPIIASSNSSTHPNGALRVKAIETGEMAMRTSLKLSSSP